MNIILNVKTTSNMKTTLNMKMTSIIRMTLKYQDKLIYEYDRTKPNLTKQNFQTNLTNQIYQTKQNKTNKPSLRNQYFQINKFKEQQFIKYARLAISIKLSKL